MHTAKHLSWEAKRRRLAPWQRNNAGSWETWVIHCMTSSKSTLSLLPYLPSGDGDSDKGTWGGAIRSLCAPWRYSEADALAKAYLFFLKASPESRGIVPRFLTCGDKEQDTGMRLEENSKVVGLNLLLLCKWKGLGLDPPPLSTPIVWVAEHFVERLCGQLWVHSLRSPAPPGGVP